AARPAVAQNRTRPPRALRFPVKILFFDVDGAPFLSWEMAALVRAGHEITVCGSRGIAPPWKSGEFEPIRSREIALRLFDGRALAALAYYFAARPLRTLAALATAVLAYLREPAYLLKLLASLGWTLSACRWAELHAIDHVHANWAHLPATSAWIVWRLTGIPFSFSGHAGRDLFRTKALLGKKVLDARFVVVCNHEARARVLAVAGDEAGARVHVHHHGVDIESFATAPAAPEYLLSVGTLAPAKGFDLAIRAVAALREEGRTLRYRIVGDGEERRRLEALATELGVRGQVDFSGRMEGEALTDAYRRAVALLAPSRLLADGGRDGLPNVVVEAMAAGVPVIASGVAAIPEAIDDGRSGILVPPEDVYALAAAVRNLLETEPESRRRLAAAARERVRRDFDRRRTVEGYCSLFAPLGGHTKEANQR
ncbi:MAG: glycosyltransferase, partial [Candidatus Binatia bacterium]